jgi:hypothetical protein
MVIVPAERQANSIEEKKWTLRWRIVIFSAEFAVSETVKP